MTTTTLPRHLPDDDPAIPPAELAEEMERAYRWQDHQDGLGDPRARTWPELSATEAVCPDQ